MTMTSSELPRLKQSKAIPPVSLKKAGRVAYKPAAAPVSAEEAARRQKSLAAEGALLSLLTVLNEAAMTDTELQVTLQAVKAALFARDYTLAFSRPDYLRAYCARWVPGRALAWRDLLLDSDTFVSACQKKALSSPEEPYRTVCIGGGAGSEVLALASVAKELLGELQLGLRVEVVDIADWRPLLHDMEALARSRWKLSDDAFALRFSHADVLDTYAGVDFASADLVTLFFTTNELFAASKPKTLALLSHLGAACKPGALLCVAESAGSYSEITLGDKTYPLDLILDQTLAARGKPWRIAEKSQSRWYRVPEETRSRYKLQLENTHMMVRVYQKRVPEKVSPIADST